MMDEPLNVREKRQSEVGNGCFDGGSMEARGGEERRDEGRAGGVQDLHAGGLLREGSDRELTDAGLNFVVKAWRDRERRREVPHWDGRQLWWSGTPVLTLKREAPAQRPILEAFEALGWPQWIADPLEEELGQDPKRRLNQTLKDLNDRLGEGNIKFKGDGTGRGIYWRVVVS